MSFEPVHCCHLSSSLSWRGQAGYPFVHVGAVGVDAGSGIGLWGGHCAQWSKKCACNAVYINLIFGTVLIDYVCIVCGGYSPKCYQCVRKKCLVVVLVLIDIHVVNEHLSVWPAKKYFVSKFRRHKTPYRVIKIQNLLVLGLSRSNPCSCQGIL